MSSTIFMYLNIMWFYFFIIFMTGSSLSSMKKVNVSFNVFI
ncbi:hypothetical protein Dd703_3888 [Musicola paradisiaca Ech703]|uniref:Uncharacterized protein n=1 Tax=Musicola paradisiaca (strain Ech703) TaxID=579405 RepID=C6C5K4_MUSP7|nr:hypothetical protein Dd703_3888 [Musicola paradisiaca Ech703]